MNEKIIGLYRSGYSLQMIGVLCGISYIAVRKRLVKCGNYKKQELIENCVECKNEIKNRRGFRGSQRYYGFCCRKCYIEWVSKNYRGGVNNFIRLFWDGMREEYSVRYIDGNCDNCRLENLLVEYRGIILFDGRRL